MTETATYQARLAEAEAALHALLTGSKAEMLTVDGKSVKYTPAKTGELRGYIAELRQPTGGNPRRVIRVQF